MKTIVKNLFVILSASSPALAANAEPEGNGLMVILFLGLGAREKPTAFLPSAGPRAM